jgi:hypothetical protein
VLRPCVQALCMQLSCFSGSASISKAFGEAPRGTTPLGDDTRGVLRWRPTQLFTSRGVDAVLLTISKPARPDRSGGQLSHAPKCCSSCWTSARAWEVTGEGEAKRPWDAAVCRRARTLTPSAAQGLSLLDQQRCSASVIRPEARGGTRGLRYPLSRLSSSAKVALCTQPGEPQGGH